MAGFNIFVYPGYFYYKANEEREKELNNKNNCYRHLVNKEAKKSSHETSSHHNSSLFEQKVFKEANSSDFMCR